MQLDEFLANAPIIISTTDHVDRHGSDQGQMHADTCL